MELIKAASGSGEDRNRAASLALLAQLISHSTFELMHNNKDKWIDTLSVIVKKVRLVLFNFREAVKSSILIHHLKCILFSSSLCHNPPANWNELSYD